MMTLEELKELVNKAFYYESANTKDYEYTHLLENFYEDRDYFNYRVKELIEEVARLGLDD